MTYGNQTNHQLCQFHLLREYLRNIGEKGFSEAVKLLRSESVAQARMHAKRAVHLSEGEAEYWCKKGVEQGAGASCEWTGALQDHFIARTIKSGAST